MSAARFARIVAENTAPKIIPKTRVKRAARIAPITSVQTLLSP